MNTEREAVLIRDPVARNCEASLEIGFELPETYNASEILFQHLGTEIENKIAIYCDSGDMTYGDLCRSAAKTGNALRSLSLAPGTRVLLFLDDTPSYPAILFGAIRAGYVPMLINTLSPKELLRFYVEDSEAEVAFFDAQYADLFVGGVAETNSLKHCIQVGSTETSLSADRSLLDWEEWTAPFDSYLPCADTNRDDMAFWMYSSGSTGRPKGIVHLQHDMAYSARSFGERVLGIREDDICFSVPKIFFAYGLGNSTYFPFSAGASAVLYKGRPTAEAVFATIEKYKPTLLFGLPTLYNSLMQSDSRYKADLSCLRLCLSAAETLSADLFNKWQQLFRHPIVEGLGSTEMTHVYLSNRLEDFRIGSAGKRVPGYDLKLTDSDGNVVMPGEEGILWVRGDSSAPCYWNRPDKTDDTMRGDWIYTGDRFVCDEDGFYFFRGRADDLIKVSGQWVYPLEVELCLAEHPLVLECAVMGVELPDRRMTLHGFVVLAPEANGVTDITRKLQGFVKRQLVPYKYPRSIDYLDALPKTGTDKIDRQALLKSLQLQPQLNVVTAGVTS